MATPRWRWGEPLGLLRATLERGGLLAIPTESSYGLAVDPRHAAAVAEVYRVKQRPGGQPLPVVAAGLEQLAALGIDVDEPLFRRLAALWPAPLSLIVPAAGGLPAAAGGETLAVRLPAHEELLELLAELGLALTATSANRSGRPPVTEPGELVPLLDGRDAVIVDGGRLPGGPPSTLVASSRDGLTVLRRGRYPIPELRLRVSDVPIREPGDAGLAT